MKTKILLASISVALMAAALIGVSAAQFANQSIIATTVNSQIEPPCVTGDYSQAPEWCLNATTGEPYGLQNRTATCPVWALSGAGEGAYQTGCGVGDLEQNHYRYGGMGRNAYGFRCGW